MGDADYAIEARQTIEAIDVESQDDPTLEAAHDRALDALDGLVDPLQEIESQSKPSVKKEIETPDEWDEDDDELDDALDDAYAKARIPQSKGTITIKTISDNDYYYLQWREGDQVKSQYIAPASSD